MSGDKVSDQQPRDTPDDVSPPPRLTRNMTNEVAVPLKLMSPGKQSEGKSKPEKDKTVAEQIKKAHTTTIHVDTQHPSLISIQRISENVVSLLWEFITKFLNRKTFVTLRKRSITKFLNRKTFVKPRETIS